MKFRINLNQANLHLSPRSNWENYHLVITGKYKRSKVNTRTRSVALALAAAEIDRPSPFYKKREPTGTHRWRTPHAPARISLPLPPLLASRRRQPPPWARPTANSRRRALPLTSSATSSPCRSCPPVPARSLGSTPPCSGSLSPRRSTTLSSPAPSSLPRLSSPLRNRCVQTNRNVVLVRDARALLDSCCWSKCKIGSFYPINGLL